MNKSLLRSAVIALFAAIICCGAFIKIPLGVIPLVLQNALCILCGVLLGGFWSAAPTGLFLLAGLIGLPVYSGGSGGLAVWLGPTGGFLPGYLLGALVAGLIAGRPRTEERQPTPKQVLRISLAIVAGMVVLYIPGVIRFAYWEESSSLSYTLWACLIPFIPGDILKIAIIIPLAIKLRPLVAQYLYADTN